MIDETGEGKPREDYADSIAALEEFIRFLIRYKSEVGEGWFESEAYAHFLPAYARRNACHAQVFDFGKLVIQETTAFDPDSAITNDAIPGTLLREAQRALKVLEEQVPEVATAA